MALDLLFSPQVAPHDSQFLSGQSFVLFFGCLFLIASIAEFKRHLDFRRMAQRNGWMYRNRTPVPGIPIRDLIGESTSEVFVTKTLEGRHADISFVVLDCKVGTGKSKRLYTIVAIRSEVSPFTIQRWSTDYELVHSDGWFALIPAKHLFFGRRLSAKRVENIVSCL